MTHPQAAISFGQLVACADDAINAIRVISIPRNFIATSRMSLILPVHCTFLSLLRSRRSAARNISAGFTALRLVIQFFHFDHSISILLIYMSTSIESSGAPSRRSYPLQ